MRSQPTPPGYLPTTYTEVERRLRELERRPAGDIRWIKYDPEITYNGEPVGAANATVPAPPITTAGAEPAAYIKETHRWGMYAELGSIIHLSGVLVAPSLTGVTFGTPTGLIGTGPGFYRIGFPTRYHPTYRRLDDHQLGWALHATKYPTAPLGTRGAYGDGWQTAVCYYRPGEKTRPDGPDALIVAATAGATGDPYDVGQYQAFGGEYNVAIAWGGWFEIVKDEPLLDGEPVP